VPVWALLFDLSDPPRAQNEGFGAQKAAPLCNANFFCP
jgi:hypothetical protein